ncbi:EthD family reductase [Pseudomonas sp. LFM046]|uniref:EthD family reductase n=1 Tax=Pseudomonas sp. LFM046 TaxID=1608357 RepID=UPI0005CFEBF2|nr:EthD family reductase [Pseudomonas sp. LFM046]
MYCFVVAYPNAPGAKFDFTYYCEEHIPLLTRLIGENLVKVEVRKGLAAADGAVAPFICMANLWVLSVEELRSTLELNGDEISADIPNYTNLAPLLQVDEVLQTA